MSTQLNTQWNQAWNVVLIMIVNSNYDTVLYGYAFRDHWVWYNGIQLSTGYISLVIWKDYNCITWYSYNSNGRTVAYVTNNFQVANEVISIMSTLESSLDQNDVWSAAKKYSDTISSNTKVQAKVGSDIAYSVVMSQSIDASIYGRFCAKGYMTNNYQVGSVPKSWGVALILWMR